MHAGLEVQIMGTTIILIPVPIGTFDVHSYNGLCYGNTSNFPFSIPIGELHIISILMSINENLI